MKKSASMTTEITELKTPTGPMKTTICKPDGAGPWPAVIVCMDAFGVRDSIVEIAERLAKSGYLTAAPELFHAIGHPIDLLPAEDRGKPGAIFKIFGDDKMRTEFFTKFFGGATDYDNLKGNIGAVLDHLDASADVVKGKIGTTGYCMGGNCSLRIATIFGDRIKATASFHGGFLATDQPNSPDKRAASITSTVYVAGAIEDDSFTDAQKQQLDAALTAAHVKHEIEWYQAKHGFAVRDNPSFDEAAAERHYKALDKLYAATLKA